MIRRTAILISTVLTVILLSAAPATAEAENCEADPRPECYGIESVGAGLSTTEAGAHPDFTLDVEAKQNPLSPLNLVGLHDAYAASRNARFNVPPGLIGDPNAIGPVQQCSVAQLFAAAEFSKTDSC